MSANSLPSHIYLGVLLGWIHGEDVYYYNAERKSFTQFTAK